LKAIADETRMKILNELEGKDGKTFVDLKNELSLLDATLARHLKALISATLVSHVYERNRRQDNPRCYSYYEITRFGRYLLNIIGNAFEDESCKIEDTN